MVVCHCGTNCVCRGLHGLGLARVRKLNDLLPQHSKVTCMHVSLTRVARHQVMAWLVVSWPVRLCQCLRRKTPQNKTKLSGGVRRLDNVWPAWHAHHANKQQPHHPSPLSCSPAAMNAATSALSC